MAESELMAENVPEAVQRLASCDSHVSSSSSGELPTPSTDPALTSPTGVAVSAADAYNRISASKDDDSDSEYGLEFNPYSFVRTLPPLSEVLPPHHKPLLPPQTRRFSRKTLVLDLDETLVRPSSLLAALHVCQCPHGVAWCGPTCQIGLLTEAWQDHDVVSLMTVQLCRDHLSFRMSVVSNKACLAGNNLPKVLCPITAHALDTRLCSSCT